ncbi:hypothetical protein NUACC21_12440 [Scytonema sp. NUACC21]
MKIAYITSHNILDKSAWSKHEQGLWAASYCISKHLQDESTFIQNISPINKSFKVLTKIKWNFYRYFFKKDYYRWAEPIVLKNHALQIQEKLLSCNFDIVLCPENVIPIAYLNCKQPIVLWTDSTLTSLINFYPHMSNLCKENIKNIYDIESAALNRCHLVIYTSDWAAQAAIDTYGIPPSKIKVLPWCANLECNRSLADIQSIVAAKSSSPCKLLFLGVNWVRKGGDIALQVVQELNNMGLTTELIVVGCIPKLSQALQKYVRVIEFIDKSNQEDLEKLNQLFLEAHFLILPSLADCTPIVFSEANSFGLPVISTNIGGIPTIIKDDLNGKTFSKDASLRDYCSYIYYLINNYSEYTKLALSSFQQYQSRLNWATAVNNAKEFMRQLI